MTYMRSVVPVGERNLQGGGASKVHENPVVLGQPGGRALR